MNPRLVIRALLGDGNVPRASRVRFPPVTIERWLWYELAHDRGGADAGGALALYRQAFIFGAPIADVRAAFNAGDVDEVALRWAETLPPVAPEALMSALREHVSDAFDAVGEVRFRDTGFEVHEVQLGAEQGNGLGWALTLVDELCAEYGWGVGYVLRQPLARLLVLRTAARIRQGAEWSGPSYEDRERLDGDDSIHDQVMPRIINPLSCQNAAALTSQPAFPRDADVTGVLIAGHDQSGHKQKQTDSN